jgi:hypothetical protein
MEVFMAHPQPRGALAAAALVLTLALAACGGRPGEPDAPAQAVQGVSTPSSVAVVTAKNAN